MNYSERIEWAEGLPVGSQAHIEPGTGGWDVTNYQWGGDFVRFGGTVTVVAKPSHVGDVHAVFVTVDNPSRSPRTRTVGVKPEYLSPLPTNA